MTYLLTDGGGGGGERKNGPLPKNGHTYPAMMKHGTVIPYLKMTQKIYESRNTSPWILLTSAFFVGNQQYQKIQIQISFL